MSRALDFFSDKGNGEPSVVAIRDPLTVIIRGALLTSEFSSHSPAVCFCAAAALALSVDLVVVMASDEVIFHSFNGALRLDAHNAVFEQLLASGEGYHSAKNRLAEILQGFIGFLAGFVMAGPIPIPVSVDSAGMNSVSNLRILPSNLFVRPLASLR